MCEGGFGCSGGGAGGGCSLCRLVLVTMRWFCILYAFLRVFGAACVRQLFGCDMMVRKRVFWLGLRRL
jgi:hypothetical protein